MRERIPKSKLTHYVGSCVNQTRQSASSAMPMARSLTFRASKYCYRRRLQAGRFEHVVGTTHNVSIERFVSVRGPGRTPKGGDGKGRSETETAAPAERECGCACVRMRSFKVVQSFIKLHFVGRLVLHSHITRGWLNGQSSGLRLHPRFKLYVNMSLHHSKDVTIIGSSITYVAGNLTNAVQGAKHFI
jgi:hypothetical protein